MHMGMKIKESKKLKKIITEVQWLKEISNGGPDG